MAFSFLYLAVRAVLGAFVRSRRVSGANIRVRVSDPIPTGARHRSVRAVRTTNL
jgi:hypothetical protein